MLAVCLIVGVFKFELLVNSATIDVNLLRLAVELSLELVKCSLFLSTDEPPPSILKW